MVAVRPDSEGSRFRLDFRRHLVIKHRGCRISDKNIVQHFIVIRISAVQCNTVICTSVTSRQI